MRLTKRAMRKALPLLWVFALALPVFAGTGATASGAENTGIRYTFSGSNAETPGYAQGTVTLTADIGGTYYLYWADGTEALTGYYEIASFTLPAGGSGSFEFGCHTAIPQGAVKIIATNTKDDLSVAGAEYVYTLPENKRLDAGCGDLLYTFNSYSDVHIDTDGYFKNASKNWAQALKFGVDKNTDFIVTSGDMVTNAAGPDSEWTVYEEILAKSDYVNPVWESDGNHDMRCGVASGVKAFVRASGTDSTTANYDANKPYYYMIEQSTGDVFIFMALEGGYNTNGCDEFSQAQIDWVTELLSKYYDSGVNVYIVEHSPIYGFGAGDRMSNPYYKAHLSESYSSTRQFKALLQKYPKLIWMSGHTHQDFSLDYNYSNENNTACHMIHNPAVAGSTKPSADDAGQDYNNGYGYNSQGYYVEVYENEIVYYGANLTQELIYPSYCYIMEGSGCLSQEETEETSVSTARETGEKPTAEADTTLPSQITEATESVTGEKPSAEADTTLPSQMTEATESETAQPSDDDAPRRELGDVNLSGEVTIKDATLIQKHLARLAYLSDTQLELADADGDGEISVGDATAIQKYLAGLTEALGLQGNARRTVGAIGSDSLLQKTAEAKSLLDSCFGFSSYDQYQALKKLYYQYKDASSGDSTVTAEFERLMSELTAVAEHIGGTPVNTIGDTYYFENTYNWSTVKCYAWTGSNKNASWPGVAVTRVGTNAGHDVYAVKFSYAGQYSNIIFNDGSSSGGAQTVDIALSSYEGNCFYLNGEKDSQGKYKVGNFTITGMRELVSNAFGRYALCYYNGTSHGWQDIDTFFTQQGDGDYYLELETSNSDNISFVVFDCESQKYSCVANSTPVTYSEGASNTYALDPGTADKGRSITVSGLSPGIVLKLAYNPDANSLRLTF